MSRRLRCLIVCLGGLAALIACVPASAAARSASELASHQATSPDSEQIGLKPAAGTPSFPASTPSVEQVRQLAQCGGIMYAVGRFSLVDSDGVTYRRRNVFAFQATAPFTLTSWNPDINGEVNSITFSNGNCHDAYLGGKFTKVGGVAAENIAEVTTSRLGKLVPAFAHTADSEVETLAAYQGHILAGGFFTTINGSYSDPYMASLNAQTGQDDHFLALGISGHVTYPGAKLNRTKVFNQQISHNGKLDLVEGDFTSAGGRRRHQVFMLNLASRPMATLTRWTSARFDGGRGYPPHGYYYNCGGTEPFYVRGASWSPDDRTIYFATTGYRPWNFKTGYPLRGLCDAAVAFSANPADPRLKWVNYTGCNSLYSVTAVRDAVFFAGHELYARNPDGCKSIGPGALSDPGLEGLNPVNGKALTNSSGAALYYRGRGIGADDMLVNKAGLWIASDNLDGTQMCEGVQGLAGICFLPAVS
jgi:hypothetical protein